jgi:glyceraldehyde 3-phosphate dehydrogenase
MAFKEAAEGKLNGIMEYCDKPLVSKDFNGNPRSSIVDAALTYVIDKRMVKVLSWYDNEWGYSCRVIDLIEYILNKGL